MVWKVVHAVAASFAAALVGSILFSLFVEGDLILEARTQARPMGGRDLVILVSILGLLAVSTARSCLKVTFGDDA